jgi:hypothetical protein
MMPAILRGDKVRHVPKEAIRRQNKYGGRVNAYSGRALYFPKGTGIGDLFSFFNANKDAIKAVTDTVSNEPSAAASIGKFATDTAKGVEEVKAIRQGNMQLTQQPHRAITDTALRNIVENEKGVRNETPKKWVQVPKRQRGFSKYNWKPDLLLLRQYDSRHCIMQMSYSLEIAPNCN